MRHEQLEHDQLGGGFSLELSSEPSVKPSVKLSVKLSGEPTAGAQIPRHSIQNPAADSRRRHLAVSQ